MNVSFHLRSALLGVTLLSIGTVALAQQTQRRTGTSLEKSGTRPPARTSDSKPQSDSRVQPAGRTTEAPRRPRPQTVEMKIEPLPPELETILREWEVESAKIKRIVGVHERFVYNSVFEVETRARGHFYYEAPDKGRIDIEGAKPDKEETSLRKSEKNDAPYRLEEEQPSKWICTGQEILSINEAEKSYEAFPLPENLQGENIINGPLPFLFGMKAEDAKKRFAISFDNANDPRKNNESVVWLKAIPRQMMDKDNFKEATIILDRKRYVPFAVKLIDPAGTLETVYKFPPKEIQINSRGLLPQMFRNDPFHPNLKNYKLILPPPSKGELEQVRESSGEKDSGIRRTSNTEVQPSKNRMTVTPKASSVPPTRTRK